ncbi:transglycosylase SLT domain-containing protein [Actinomycetospora sp. TBRC 11914]|nr:transglycosylase SLT domain-containing protein [Actinomycetospora sp. TBRC 11914]
MTGWSRMRSPDAGVSGSSGASSRWADRRQVTPGADHPVQAARITGGDDGGSGDGGSGDGGSGDDAGSPHATHSGSGSAHHGDSGDDGGAASGDDGGSGEATAGPGGGPPGKVGDWIRRATAILAQHGVPADKMDPDAIATIIHHESGGDPDATNGWDSNAAKGTPSIGLMQTIGPTFAAHKLPGHGDIHDPVDNIIAGVRYAIERYGSVSRVPGVQALAHGHGYVGY